MNTNTATNKLNELFKRWQEKHPEYEGKFTKDGINDESIYNEQKPKLLFIEKEKNDPEQSPRGFPRVVGCPQTRKKICWATESVEWSYWIFNGLPWHGIHPEVESEESGNHEKNRIHEPEKNRRRQHDELPGDLLKCSRERKRFHFERNRNHQSRRHHRRDCQRPRDLESHFPGDQVQRLRLRHPCGKIQVIQGHRLLPSVQPRAPRP